MAQSTSSMWTARRAGAMSCVRAMPKEKSRVSVAHCGNRILLASRVRAIRFVRATPCATAILCVLVTAKEAEAVAVIIGIQASTNWRQRPSLLSVLPEGQKQ